jgi:pSer/pThr/pTyr-binding forkhead associated (FHA) protein
MHRVRRLRHNGEVDPMTIPRESSEPLPPPELDPLEPPTINLPQKVDSVPGQTMPEHQGLPCDTILLVFEADRIETNSVPIGKVVLIGRDHPSNRRQPEVNLTDSDGLSKGISRLHATIRHDANGWWLIDLGSSNGSWLNRKHVAPSTPHRLGEVNEVRLGRLDFRIIVPKADC